MYCEFESCPHRDRYTPFCTLKSCAYPDGLTRVVYGDDSVVYYADPSDVDREHPDGIESIENNVDLAYVDPMATIL